MLDPAGSIPRTSVSYPSFLPPSAENNVNMFVISIVDTATAVSPVVVQFRDFALERFPKHVHVRTQ